jgi:hypothetical protein
VRSRPALPLALAVALVVVAPTVATSGDAPAQGIPEYGLVVSAIAGGLESGKGVFTCSGASLAEIAEALSGPAAFHKLATELTAQALGSEKKPWPKNTHAFTYQGRRRVPDFVKGRSFYDVDTGKTVDLTPELRDEQAIARREGRDVVIVTRRSATVSPTLSKAITRSGTRRAGRIRVVRCI